MNKIKRLWGICRPYIGNPVFLAVLALKMGTGSFFAAEYFLRERSLPFVQFWVDSGFSADPWAEFLSRGLTDAFPYSSMMLAVLAAPQALFAPFFGGAGQMPVFLSLFLMRVPMALADITIYVLLCRWFETKSKSVLWLYWCSPVLFYISYVHGQIDAIPTAFLFVSLWYAVRVSPWWAGAFLAAGLATKFHLAVAAPLIGLYLVKAVRLPERQKVLLAYVAALVGTFLALTGPLLFSEGYKTMVLGAKEMSWVYAQVFVMPRGLNVLLCPAALVALVLHFFSYRTITKDILILYTGLVFTLLLVLVTPMPGWTFWCLPFICYFLIRQEVSSYLPFWMFTTGYLAYYLVFEPVTATLGADMYLPPDKMSLGRDASFTVMQTSLVLVAAWIYRIGVRSYVQYKARSKTLAIGIGGDSGAGKNTLADVLGEVLGTSNLVVLHGDDYHRWEREHKAWEGVTHLDPRSNYFSEPNEHILNLKNGISIKRKRYDHASGKFTDSEDVDPNNIVLFEGLHPFVFKRMRNVFDIKIFVNTEESLRRLWKVRRDSVERGYEPEKVLSEIEKRMEDSEKFIRPQAKFADWVIEYEPKVEVDPLAEKGDPVELRVRHTVSSEVVEIEDLTEELRRRGAEDLRVRWSLEPSLERQVLSVEGELPAQFVREIAYKIFPDLDEFLPAEPAWRGGVHGMNQLVFLTLYRWVVER